MKTRLIFNFFVFPILLFSQNNKFFDSCTIGLTYGFGNSFYESTALNALLIEKGYFPVYDNNNFDRPPNAMNFGVEIHDKITSLYCRLSILKSIHLK